MKSRELHTTPVIIVSNYTITPDPSGKYLHSFTPQNTGKKYQFLANAEPLLDEDSRYNVGYEKINGLNWVDVSATAKADEVNPAVSHYVARQLGEQKKAREYAKSDARVVYSASDGKYLGKKYAWRIYGMAIARGTFDDYMAAINHPRVACLTEGTESIAYKEFGIDSSMQSLINSCVRVGNSGNRFSSPLLPGKKWFQIKGLSAITDKK